MPAKLAVSAKGTVMPSEVPMTASSVVCEEGLQKDDFAIRAFKLDGEGALTIEAQERNCSWLLLRGTICDSISKPLNDSVLAFSNVMHSESIESDSEDISISQCEHKVALSQDMAHRGALYDNIRVTYSATMVEARKYPNYPC